MKKNDPFAQRYLEEQMKNKKNTADPAVKTYSGITNQYANAIRDALDKIPISTSGSALPIADSHVADLTSLSSYTPLSPYSPSFGLDVALKSNDDLGKEDTKPDGSDTVSDNTNTQGNAPSKVYDDALAYIREQINDMRPQKDTQIGQLINDYLNRGDFKYDPNADMLYQNYLAAMQNAGQMAMKDTMGQAAMLTGGYGSSYATAAANGAYNSYLQKANEALPDYYNIAANAYDRQGNDLLSQIQLLQNKDDVAYKRWLDQMKLVSEQTKPSSESSELTDKWTSEQENKTRREALSIYKERGEEGLFEYLDSLSGYNLSDETMKGIIDFVEQYGQNNWEMTKDAWIPFPVARNQYTDSRGDTKTYSELEREHEQGKISDEDWELIKSLTKKGQTTKDRR